MRMPKGMKCQEQELRMKPDEAGRAEGWETQVQCDNSIQMEVFRQKTSLTSGLKSLKAYTACGQCILTKTGTWIVSKW